MQPILFRFAEARTRGRNMLGVGPSLVGRIPLPTLPALYISGITKDASGAALAGCAVQLFRTADDVLIEEIVSDGSGAFAFSPVGPALTFYVVAYKAGGPDVAGTTVNTLVGT